MKTKDIDPQVYALYDEYCHGRIDRREFFKRAAGVVAGVSGLAMAQALMPRYAEAATVSFNDPAISARYVDYPSPGGTADTIRGYLVRPAQEGRFPAVVVIHENRGLNPYIEDVARRLAVAGFIALAPDGLSSLGGYPGNDDEGREMQRQLDQAKLRQDMLNGARWLQAHERSTGKLGATGFCWGGGVTNFLAVEMDDALAAAAPYYGPAPSPDDVPRIRAPIQAHYAEDDERINAMIPAFEQAAKQHGIEHEIHIYPGTRHGFHNNSTPRYDEKAAELAWGRTLSFFTKHLVTTESSHV